MTTNTNAFQQLFYLYIHPYKCDYNIYQDTWFVIYLSHESEHVMDKFYLASAFPMVNVSQY